MRCLVNITAAGCLDMQVQCIIKGLSSREAARGHATNVDGEMLSVTINRIYNYFFFSLINLSTMQGTIRIQGFAGHLSR